MNRDEFISNFKTANENIDRERISNIINKADDFGLQNFEVRGHENLIIDMEEMAELAQEISKCLRKKGINDYYSLIEEMADVRICLYHLQTLYNISDEELNKAINVKMDRMERRLLDLMN